jgi:probable phosphoglycerate mutase|tara:strand:- start:212 stop:754 length:543 start_codon:yes stop_codon:yes gene_type:complete
MSNLFLRHGEVQNEKNVFYANLPGFYLSSKGEMQAKDAAIKIKKLFNIQKIISSPLLRARQTASIVSKELKINIEVSNNIIEWSGPYEWIGKTIEEIKITDSFKNYNNNPLNLNNTMESLKNVHDRFKLEYEKYENTLFVSHQDTIRAFTYYYLKENDFTKNRPDHCELQFINNNVINSY